MREISFCDLSSVPSNAQTTQETTSYKSKANQTSGTIGFQNAGTWGKNFCSWAHGSFRLRRNIEWDYGSFLASSFISAFISPFNFSFYLFLARMIRIIESKTAQSNEIIYQCSWLLLGQRQQSRKVATTWWLHSFLTEYLRDNMAVGLSFHYNHSKSRVYCKEIRKIRKRIFVRRTPIYCHGKRKSLVLQKMMILICYRWTGSLELFLAPT